MLNLYSSNTPTGLYLSNLDRTIWMCMCVRMGMYYYRIGNIKLNKAREADISLAHKRLVPVLTAHSTASVQRSIARRSFPGAYPPASPSTTSWMTLKTSPTIRTPPWQSPLTPQAGVAACSMDPRDSYNLRTDESEAVAKKGTSTPGSRAAARARTWTACCSRVGSCSCSRSNDDYSKRPYHPLRSCRRGWFACT